MKNIAIILMFLACAHLSYAQNAFNTNFKNSASATVELSLGAKEVTITGKDTDEVTIETVGGKKTNSPAVPDTPPPIPDRAKGLAPVSANSNDNTGLGLRVEKTDDYLRIVSMPNIKVEKVMITLPKNVKLVFADIMHPSSDKSNFSISDFTNEITVTSLNSSFKVERITGPLVLNTTNGNAEIIYDVLKTTKPISIVTVNGFVDLSMPASTKADLNFHTMNGQIYTDFEIEKEKSQDMNITDINMFHLDGKISGGGVPVNINTVNGDIYFRKK